jgi:hypothetical protein
MTIDWSEDEIGFLLTEYGEADDSTLTQDARELKSKVLKWKEDHKHCH